MAETIIKFKAIWEDFIP